MSIELLLKSTETVGLIAFAISGVLTAVENNLDLFGIGFVGVLTAVGGGIMRDILMRQFPPLIFYNKYACVVVLLTIICIVIVFESVHKKHIKKTKETMKNINNILDAIGLGTFTVVGTEMAYNEMFGYNILFAICMGMTTCIGGGIIRDILVTRSPGVLRKHIYALASLFGSGVYMLLSNIFGKAVDTQLL